MEGGAWTPASLAHHDTARLCSVLAEIGGVGAPIGSGWMACDAPGSWARYAAGLGREGAVDADEIDALVRFYVERGCVPRVETTPFQHQTLFTVLAERGFVVEDTETALVHPLRVVAPLARPAGCLLREVDRRSVSDEDAFVASQCEGFGVAGDRLAGFSAIMRRVVQSQRTRLWLIEQGGVVVGSGGLEYAPRMAVMIAGCVHTSARRQGLHGALIRMRLHAAREAGAEVCLVASKKGGPTERNAVRAGFSVAYQSQCFWLPGAVSESARSG